MRLNTIQMLDKMLEVMATLQDIDDASFTTKMKVLNNIDFLLDVLMDEYEKRLLGSKNK